MTQTARRVIELLKKEKSIGVDDINDLKAWIKRSTDNAANVKGAGATRRVVKFTTQTTANPQPEVTDMFDLTAQATAVTFGNPTGICQDDQKLIIRIRDNGTPRAISWGSNYADSDATLPSITTTSKTLLCGFIYNSNTSKWNLVATSLEV